MIEAVNVSYIYQTKYQKTKALSEVSCSFERGKVYAITGKSGSGKSTFLSLLAGLDVPTEGTLNIEGEDMREINRDDYRLNRASVIYQAFHLFPLLTVLENVMFPMQLKHVPVKEAKERAQEYLKRVDLPETLYTPKVVWNRNEKEAFIDSLKNGYPVPLFLFSVNEYKGQRRQEIIDGMQRLNADIMLSLA